MSSQPQPESAAPAMPNWYEDMLALVELTASLENISSLVDERLRDIVRSQGVSPSLPIAPRSESRPITSVGGAFRALNDISMTISAVHATDASSATPTPHATINSPRSRPPPANTNITRLASNFAITPQALAADLATRSVRDRPGKCSQASWQTNGVSGGLQQKVDSLQAAYDAYYQAYYAARVYRCAPSDDPLDVEPESVPDIEGEESAEDDPASSPVASPIRRVIVIDDD